MKKLKLNKIGFAAAEVLSRAQLKKVMGGYGSAQGTPGGSNGNPCVTIGCESLGGEIICVGTINGVNVIFDDNCSNHPELSGVHNMCMNDATGNYWC